MNGFILNWCIQRVYVISPSKLQHIYHSFRLASFPNHTNVKMWLLTQEVSTWAFVTRCNKNIRPQTVAKECSECIDIYIYIYIYIYVKAGGTGSDIYREYICFRWAKRCTMRKFETPRQSRIYKPCLPSELYCLTVWPGFLCLVSCWHFQRKPQNETVISRRHSLSGARGWNRKLPGWGKV
jgi:hypothetical protein